MYTNANGSWWMLTISRQHLLRNHCAPEFQCDRCGSDLVNQTDLRAHLRADVPCMKQDLGDCKILREDQIELGLRGRNPVGLDRTKYWFRVYDTIFGPEARKHREVDPCKYNFCKQCQALLNGSQITPDPIKRSYSNSCIFLRFAYRQSSNGQDRSWGLSLVTPSSKILSYQEQSYKKLCKRSWPNSLRIRDRAFMRFELRTQPLRPSLNNQLPHETSIDLCQTCVLRTGKARYRYILRQVQRKFPRCPRKAHSDH